MQISNFLIAVTALCATSASAKCFNTGKNWGNHDVAKAELVSACIEMAGPFAPGQTKTRCRNSPTEDKSFKFELQNETGNTAGISADECQRNIGAQIDNCGHGGEITTSGVRFRYVLNNAL